jgi:hypothetical protein
MIIYLILCLNGDLKQRLFYEGTSDILQLLVLYYSWLSIYNTWVISRLFCVLCEILKSYTW